MKKCFVLFAFIFYTVSLCAAQGTESSGVERYAIFVGSNEGGKNNQRLMYAGTDAIAFQKTMSEIGGIPSSNAILLLDPTKDDLNEAMLAVSEKIRENSEKLKRSEFLFYYSGHSDENALLLGKVKYDYSSLKAAITNVPSDVHVVILDSCYSGNFIRTKGGQKKKPFLFDDSSVVKGHAYLSSSSSQEFSQESDEIGSSFFTNAMLTGLRGAADSSGDKKVTLNELYSYAFNETLSKTEKTSAGPQHPNYNITLVGSGDLVLSDISASDCVVQIAADIKGRIIIRSKYGNLVSEINKLDDKPVFLALEKGEYSVTLIEKNKTLQGTFKLTSSKVYELNTTTLKPVAETNNRVRGDSSDSEAAADETFDADDGNDDEDEDRDDDNGKNKMSFSAQILDDETVYVPVEFSLVNNEISRAFNRKVITSISFALVRSSVYKVNGAMVSSILNEAEYVNGIQDAGILNKAGNVYGIQAAGIINLSSTLKGVQTAGIVNYNNGAAKGVQVSGIFNRSGETHSGAQVSGIANYAGKFDGSQVSGIFNKASEMSGIQFSGIVNYTGKLASGIQIGLINIAPEADGFQLGFINFSRTGIFEFGLSYTSNNNLRIAFNSGNRHLYTVLGYESMPKNILFSDSSNSLYNVFIGFGTRLNVGPVNFDFELLGNESYDKETDGSSEKTKDEKIIGMFFPSVKASVGVTPIKHLNLFASVILCGQYDGNEDAFKKKSRKYIIENEYYNVYPEFEFGIRYSLN
ncbi:MAG: caspase family protein [Treponema sp.]|nr:caspase family protein [Treponema sp.]